MYIVESDFIYENYRCVVTFRDHGYRCGYVGVRKDDYLYNKDLKWVDEFFIVHGGLTYYSIKVGSDFPVNSNLWWFGFDCGHAYDLPDIDKLEELWGYVPSVKTYIDICKKYNNSYDSDWIVWSKEYVEKECKNLADQFAEYNKNFNVR